MAAQSAAEFTAGPLCRSSLPAVRRRVRRASPPPTLPASPPRTLPRSPLQESAARVRCRSPLRAVAGGIRAARSRNELGARFAPDAIDWSRTAWSWPRAGLCRVLAALCWRGRRRCTSRRGRRPAGAASRPARGRGRHSRRLRTRASGRTALAPQHAPHTHAPCALCAPCAPHTHRGFAAGRSPWLFDLRAAACHACPRPPTGIPAYRSATERPGGDADRDDQAAQLQHARGRPRSRRAPAPAAQRTGGWAPGNGRAARGAETAAQLPGAETAAQLRATARAELRPRRPGASRNGCVTAPGRNGRVNGPVAAHRGGPLTTGPSSRDEGAMVRTIVG